jgi:hypothetical protein
MVKKRDNGDAIISSLPPYLHPSPLEREREGGLLCVLKYMSIYSQAHSLIGLSREKGLRVRR